MGKVIIMSTQPQQLPPLPTGSEAPSLAPGPISPVDIRTLFTAVEIYRSLGGLYKAVENLEATTRTSVEKIEQLVHKTDELIFHVPLLEKAVARNEKDLNELGKRHDKDIVELKKIAHTTQTLGTIALSGIGVAILAYLYHHVMQVLAK